MSEYIASVIIPTYNRLHELRLTLSSLAKQVCKYAFEVIVADDGSSENVKGIIDEYLDTINIKYCFHQNKGYRAAATRNMGIKLSKSNICIFIDNGIILHSKAIENHIKIHLCEKSPCAVIGYTYGFDELDRVDELKLIVDHNEPDHAIQKLIEHKIYDSRENIYSQLGDELHKWPAAFIIFWSCNVSVSKDTLVEIGMFDECFTSWGGEDTDLGLSLQKNNVKFILSRDASSIHYPHEKEKLGKWDKKNKQETIKQLEVKKQYLLKKHPIAAMGKWMTVYNPIKLNEALLREMQ